MEALQQLGLNGASSLISIVERSQRTVCHTNFDEIQPNRR